MGHSDLSAVQYLSNQPEELESRDTIQLDIQFLKQSIIIIMKLHQLSIS